MNIFEQVHQEASYLLPTELNTVLRMLNGMQSHPPDVTKLEGCNVIAVLPVGTYMLFSINPNNETPPNRNVKCYFHGNGVYTERDVVEVFKFIQSEVVAYARV